MVDDDYKLAHLSEQELAFMEAGGSVRNLGCRVYDQPPGSRQAPRKHRRSRRTGGSLPSGAHEAWVYVATAPDGCVKIGMTTDTPKRMKQIGGSLRMAVHVHPVAARHIETEAFQMLGHDLTQGEWLGGCPFDAMAAVWTAYTAVARRMPVVPGLAENDARMMRIALAKRSGVC